MPKIGIGSLGIGIQGSTLNKGGAGAPNPLPSIWANGELGDDVAPTDAELLALHNYLMAA